MRFYKSTHCSLMLTTFCLGVNAVCQGPGTCQQLLRVSVQRTFHYFFKLCGTFFVVGFWHLGSCVCMWVRACVEVKMYIWMKLNQTFTPSLVRLSHLEATFNTFKTHPFWFSFIHVFSDIWWLKPLLLLNYLPSSETWSKLCPDPDFSPLNETVLQEKVNSFSNASFSFFLKEIITQVCSNNTDLEPAVHSWATGAASSPICVFRTAYVDPKVVSHWFLRLLRSVENTPFEARPSAG